MSNIENNLQKELPKYKLIGGIYFPKNTLDEIARIICTAYNTNQKLKFYLGDTETGRDWCEEYETIGTIGRSTGPIKIPLLIRTSRSNGGSALMTDSIVKIVDFKSKMVLYKHPKYVAPTVEIVPSDTPEYTHNTIVNGKLHGRHKSLRSAQICKSKIA